MAAAAAIVLQEICEQLTAHCPNSPVARAMRTGPSKAPPPGLDQSQGAGNGSTSAEAEPSGFVEDPSRLLISFLFFRLHRFSDPVGLYFPRLREISA